MKKNWIIFSVSIIAMSTTAFVFSNISEKVEYVNSGKAGCKPPEQEKQNPKEDKSIEWKYWSFERVNVREYINEYTRLNATGIPFQYKVESRFNSTLTKTDLKNATSITDLIPNKKMNIDYNKGEKSTIGISDDFGNISNIYTSENPNESLAEFKSAIDPDYNTNIQITSKCPVLSASTCGSGDYENIVYYMTLVPEIQATYSEGKIGLVNYLEKESLKEVQKIKDTKQLEPGQIKFTIGTTGEIKNYKLIHTCGFKAVDMQMLSLINNMPGKWTPAKDANGNTVEQTFVYFFGIEGC